MVGTLGAPMFYVSDDMADIWVKAADASFNEARAVAAREAREFIGEWGRTKFLGRGPATLHEHEPAGPITDECHPYGCAEADAYHFEVYEK